MLCYLGHKSEAQEQQNKKKANASADSFLCIELVNLIRGASFKLLT